MEDKELFIRAQKGEREAKELLFSKNTGLVHHVVKNVLFVEIQDVLNVKMDTQSTQIEQNVQELILNLFFHSLVLV